MSDSDDKKLFEGFGDVDWDAALNKLDKESKAPEATPDAKPLITPIDEAKEPSEAPQPNHDAEKPDVASEKPPTEAASGDTATMPPRYASVPTIIAVQPPKSRPPLPILSAESPPSPRSSIPPSRRGGLSQLFSRSSPLPPHPAEQSVPPPLAPTAPDLVPDHGADHELVPAEIVAALQTDAAPEEHAQEHAAPPSAQEYAAPPKEEREAPRWVDDAGATELRNRAEWLEEEARAMRDPTAQARTLLAVSELHALCNDRERAHALADEARELAPTVALAWRQTRQLSRASHEDLAALLDAETAYSPTPASRVHATLLAADILRVHGRRESAIERWNVAREVEPADVRAPVARSALALAQSNHSVARSDLTENPKLHLLDRAVATALALRGASQAGVDTDAMIINDGLRRTRVALEASDANAAAQSAAEIAAEPSVAKAALWLSAAFGATHRNSRRNAASALKTLLDEGESAARRQLAARGIELGDAELVEIALVGNDAFSPAERAALLTLMGKDPSSVLERESESLPPPLLDAIAAVSAEGADTAARPARTSGEPKTRALATLGRLLAAKAEVRAVDEVLAKLPIPLDSSAAGVAIEMAIRDGRAAAVGESLSHFPADQQGAEIGRYLAAALVAERAAQPADAVRAWSKALRHGGAHDGIVRALAKVDKGVDLPTSILGVTDAMPEGVPKEILRLEAVARGTPDDARAVSLLEQVHAGAASLGIAEFLLEHLARKHGNGGEALRWVEEQRTSATDPFEISLDAVREALLVADSDAPRASARLQEAHRAHPDDVALRELFERLATEPPTDWGQWRERRAEKATGLCRALLFTEAALDYEAAGNDDAALRAATSAREAGDKGLSSLIAERAAIASGATREMTGKLAAFAKATNDRTARREAFERLADIEAYGHKDIAAAHKWHRSALEIAPLSKPSLRFVEHALMTQGNENELDSIFEQIAFALDGTGDGEAAGHMQLAAHLRSRRSGWDRTSDLVRLANRQPEPSLWAIRALHTHARAQRDEETVLSTAMQLVGRTQRPAERATLLLRASEAANHLGRNDEARAHLEQAANEDPGDVITWGLLAEMRANAGEMEASADAYENLARTSSVPNHQLLAWYDAARVWLEQVSDVERGMSALEQCAEIDATYEDVFDRLAKLYAERGLDAELASLLERRLEKVYDDGERVALEVELARAMLEMGELGKAKHSLESALDRQPDHTTALSAMAELCAKEGDWAGAEQAYVRLARLLPTDDEQRAVYEHLAEIYAVHTVNLSRAEVAYREVLKRAPSDVATREKLIEIYRRQGNVAQAVAVQQELVAEATNPELRLTKLMELARIYEVVGRDARRAEQVLESARREYPSSVVALRTMAEFYSRQHQMPAMQILLDRAAGDARRALTAGRFTPEVFEVLNATYELRGKKDAVRVVTATIAAVEGRSPTLIAGADARAVDPRLDDLLAPEILSPALRALLLCAGEALDTVSLVDLRALHATPLVPGTPLGTTIGTIATVVGLGALQILVSPQLARVAIPLSSNPPKLLVGAELLEVPKEPATTFIIVRALKMIHARTSALLRGQPRDVAVLMSALFTTFNPHYKAPGIDSRWITEIARQIGSALPRNLDRNVGLIALEAAGTLGTHANLVLSGAVAWANRVALMTVGDPAVALDAVAWTRGEGGAPKDAEPRAAWIGYAAEARDLMMFSVTDAYIAARAMLGLG
ncbi:MAG: hypothetical protein FWD69_08830 [Polyangiaceae bacterium]|nr:hypothetical protein [Polyangiaceae bacterium]